MSKKKIPFERSFASCKNAEKWSLKNELRPEEVALKSHKEALFDCNICKHEFTATISNMSRNCHGCSYCGNKKLCINDNCDFCFQRSFASCKFAKFWSKKNVDENNNLINPRNISLNSHEEYFFDCEKCKHIYNCALYDIKKRTNGCPFCCEPPKQLCDDKNCNLCFEKSFSSHEKSLYWSLKNILSPRQVFKNDNEKYIFDCSICNHNFYISLSCIVQKQWCHFCSHNELCDDEICKFCFDNSFASSKFAEYWSDKNELKPRQVFLNDNKKYYFNSSCCNHELYICLNSLKTKLNCCYCGHKKLCENENCQDCFERSFASHPKVEFWSKKNNKNPRNVFKNQSTIKYMFDCNKCKGEYNILLVDFKRGYGCQLCKNKTEKKLLDSLLINYESVEFQFYINWCINPETNRFLPFDFVLHDLKIIIELDGKQHFEQVSNWRSPEEQFKFDIYKMKCANQNGYSVIRIYQKDVYSDRIDWLNIIKKSIEEIKTKNIIENHYISFDENLYKKYIEELHN